MTEFETALLRELSFIRSQYAEHDVSHMYFTITASGRVDGDLNIVFRADSFNSETKSVDGNTIYATLVEFFRRNDWKKAHAGLCLPNVPSDEGAVETAKNS